jgi:hypothetical protein
MMSGDHNQYQKPDKCGRCGEVNPAEIHTCSPQEPVGWLMKPNEDIQPEWGGLKSHVVEKIPEGWNGYHAVPLYTAPREEGCAECGKKSSDGWALYCVKCIEAVQEPIGWVYEDDEGRMIFSQMPHPDPLWEPVYRAKRHD